MQITVDIPDEIVQRLGQKEEALAHKLREIVIADAYRSGALSTAEVRRILELPSRSPEAQKTGFFKKPVF